MYLVDTNVISEVRKKSKANQGVQSFFKQVVEDDAQIFISVVTVGELRRGVESIRFRGDARQANQLEKWLSSLLTEHQDQIPALIMISLNFGDGCAYRTQRTLWTSKSPLQRWSMN